MAAIYFSVKIAIGEHCKMGANQLPGCNKLTYAYIAAEPAEKH
jgi:hypothetical protein